MHSENDNRPLDEAEADRTEQSAERSRSAFLACTPCFRGVTYVGSFMTGVFSSMMGKRNDSEHERQPLTAEPSIAREVSERFTPGDGYEQLSDHSSETDVAPSVPTSTQNSPRLLSRGGKVVTVVGDEEYERTPSSLIKDRGQQVPAAHAAKRRQSMSAHQSEIDHHTISTVADLAATVEKLSKASSLRLEVAAEGFDDEGRERASITIVGPSQTMSERRNRCARAGHDLPYDFDTIHDIEDVLLDDCDEDRIRIFRLTLIDVATSATAGATLRSKHTPLPSRDSEMFASNAQVDRFDISYGDNLDGAAEANPEDDPSVLIGRGLALVDHLFRWATITHLTFSRCSIVPRVFGNEIKLPRQGLIHLAFSQIQLSDPHLVSLLRHANQADIDDAETDELEPSRSTMFGDLMFLQLSGSSLTPDGTARFLGEVIEQQFDANERPVLQEIVVPSQAAAAVRGADALMDLDGLVVNGKSLE